MVFSPCFGWARGARHAAWLALAAQSGGVNKTIIAHRPPAFSKHHRKFTNISYDKRKRSLVALFKRVLFPYDNRKLPSCVYNTVVDSPPTDG
jgi:hypothetical protein